MEREDVGPPAIIAPVDLTEARARANGSNIGPLAGAMMERMADEIERLRSRLIAEHEALLEAWGNMDNAAQRVSCSLPSQIGKAVEQLDAARLAIRAEVYKVVRS